MKTKVELQPISIERMEITIEGVSPLIQHKWSEKARTMMREKKGGKKTTIREVCNPEREMEDATHYTSNGSYGIPVAALKTAIINAAHKDIGIEKTLVRKSLFILCDDPGGILEMECADPIMREDCVRVGMGKADLRYRPEFSDWSVRFVVEFDAGNLKPSDIVYLIDRAGFGVGLCEWRPEKGGDFGRFRIKGGDNE